MKVFIYHPKNNDSSDHKLHDTMNLIKSIACIPEYPQSFNETNQGVILKTLLECDAIYLFKDWEYSKDTQLFKKVSEYCGKLILYEDFTINPIKKIIKAIELATGLSFEDFCINNRERYRVFARFIFSKYCDEHNCDIDLEKQLNSSRCTIDNYINSYHARMKYDKKFSELVSKVEFILGEPILS